MIKQMEDKRKWISDKLIQYVDILFAVVVGQSIVHNVDLLKKPTSYPFAILALIIVIITVTLSWIGYHKSLYKYPYTAEAALSLRRVLRPFNDFLIVVLYARFLLTIDDFQTIPAQINLLAFILCYAGIFFLYITDGFIRIYEYKDHGASKLRLSVWFLGWYLLTLVFYIAAQQFLNPYLFIINWLILIICLGLYLRYRLQREPFYDDPKSVPSVVVDVDGVLADQVTPILEILNKKYRSNYVKKDIKHWDQSLPRAKTDIKTAIESSHLDPEIVLNMKPIQDAPSVMRELSRYCRITIATNRTKEANNPTKQWLRSNNIPYDEYHNTSIEGKGAAKGHLIIDDYPGNIVKFLAAEEGRIGLIFTQPWNEKDKTLIDLENVYRVSNWQEVLEKVRLLL